MSDESLYELLLQRPRLPNTLPLPNGDVLLYQPNEVLIDIPFEMSFPKPASVDFHMFMRCGGVVPRRDRIITIVDPPAMPSGLPGVEAMLADGWVWDGWREGFKREGGFIRLARVQGGRYALHLPTNRKRSRQRRKRER